MEVASLASTRGGSSLTTWATSRIPTAFGEAELISCKALRPRGRLVLLHGAGSGTDVALFISLAAAMAERNWDILRIEQPYRVQGRKAPAPANQLDEVVRTVVTGWGGRVPLVLAGRSSGGRVACRVGVSLGASLVVAFGFPLQPPGDKPNRQAELDAAGLPVLVVQGTRDSFGMPRNDARRQREVWRVEGANHDMEGLRGDDPIEEVVIEVAERLDQVAST